MRSPSMSLWLKATPTWPTDTIMLQPTIHPWNQELWQQLTLEPDRSNHALLFHGNNGLGKFSLAIALAHFVLTDNHTQSASLFEAGSHPDLHVVMPEALGELKKESGPSEHVLMANYASRYLEAHSGKPRKTITIDQIRKLSSALATHPHISEHRVILIFAADTMNRNAANALLKSLEEPPANTLFVIVSNEVSVLPKTIRSRCSLVNFHAPDRESALAWLSLQNSMPADECDTYLSISNNHPLQAIELFKNGYLESLKSVLTDVNHLWMRRVDITGVAKKWQTLGALTSVDILQKLATDLLRFQLCDSPEVLFFPVQKSWVQSSSKKVSRDTLLALLDELNNAKRLLATTVDELLLLETVAQRTFSLPI